jgi:hypothetical protein
MNSFYGMELIAKTEDYETAKSIKEKEEESREPGYWSVYITTEEQKEFCCFD